MVEITIERYEALLAAERDAALLKKLLAHKAEGYAQITTAEVRSLNRLFGTEEHE